MSILKNNTKLLITREKYGHDFRIGETVKVIDSYKDKFLSLRYKCTSLNNDEGEWWVWPSEFNVIIDSINPKITIL